MKKILVIVFLISTAVFLSGCTQNDNADTNQDQETNNEPLYIILDSGKINNSRIYLDIQNIDTKTIRCHVNFLLKYVDEDSVGQKNYGGGTTIDTGPNDIYEKSQNKFIDIEPHHTERRTCSIYSYSGYFFLSWDYSCSAEYL